MKTPMLQFTTPTDMRAFSRAQRQAGKRLACVPTMGALHAGHLSLIKQASSAADLVVATIYVNPTQFDNPEDLAAYPKTLEADLEMLAKAGVAAVYLPTNEVMYPNGYCTFVEVIGPLTDKLCAVARPGHFRGVTTVVTKLFNAVEPDVAIFGEKDLQQVLIINRMVRDLDLPVEIQVAPTLRDPDGLAMSSRNRRLTPEMRIKALGLPRGLELVRRAFNQGETRSMKLIEILANELLIHEGVDLDYGDVISLADFSEAESADGRCTLAAAVFIDGVRLIDHILLDGPAIAVNVDD